jgi:glycerol-3-phosphate acyltransferase PlsY
MTVLIYLGYALASYLLGSIPTGYVWARARGVDIRKVGSGNIGATNVMRALGKGPGITVLLIDALKGWLPVFLAPRLITPAEINPSALQIVCCLGVIAGHNWTCWLKFKGGKGIATSAGALFAFLPKAMGVTLGVWAAVFALSRYVSLASIIAALALPIATWGFYPEDRVFLGFTTLLSAIAIIKHRSNIQRLLAGTENRIGGTKPAQGQGKGGETT